MDEITKEMFEAEVDAMRQDFAITMEMLRVTQEVTTNLMGVLTRHEETTVELSRVFQDHVQKQLSDQTTMILTWICLLWSLVMATVICLVRDQRKTRSIIMDMDEKRRGTDGYAPLLNET